MKILKAIRNLAADLINHFEQTKSDPITFLSYNTADISSALMITNWLERDGIKIFFAKRDIEIAQPWREAIVDAVYDSNAFVCLYGPKGLSHGQIREIKLAQRCYDEKQYKITSVLLPECKSVQKMNCFLKKFQYADLRPDFSTTNNEYKRLVEMIVRHNKKFRQ
jgi:hypothetical protein